MKPAQKALQAYQKGQREEAFALAKAAVEQSPDDTNARQVMALVFQDNGQTQDAIQVLSEGLAPEQNAPGAWTLLISFYFNSGQHDEAAKSLARAGGVVHQSAALRRLACLVQCAVGEFESAQQEFEALALRADATADWVTDCVKALSSKRNRRPSINLLEVILERWPDHEDLRWNAIQAAGRAKDYPLALKFLAPFLAENLPEAFLTQVKALLEINRSEEAEQAAKRGLELEPDSVALMTNLARALRMQEKFEEALVILDEALRRDPHYASTYVEFGHIYTRWGNQRDLALEWLERGLKASNHVGVRNNLSLELLSRGQFERGFALYESRLDPELGLGNQSVVKLPIWQGEDLTGKHLVVWGEQALGEQQLHFQAIARLLERPDVSPAQLTIICDHRLIPIFERSHPAITYLDKQKILDDPSETAALGDYTIAIGSLHNRLGADVVRHYGKGPYLKCHPGWQQKLRAKYERLAKGRPIVGVAWGSANPTWGTEKTIRPEVFGAALSGTGCFFVNLQYATTEEGLNRVRRSFTENEDLFDDDEVDSLNELESFFAQVAACDLIATISNSTAHAAGAQGVPAVVLMPRGRGALWYWFQSNDIPGWYSSVTVHRQEIAGEWAKTLTAMKLRLLDLSAGVAEPQLANVGSLKGDLNAAEKAHADGDLLTAWALCAPLVSREDVPFEVLRLAGLLQMKLGETDFGLCYLTQAVELSSEDSDVWLFLARGYYEKHNLITALETLEKARAFGLDAVQYESLLADIRFAQGQEDDGIASLRRAAQASRHPGTQLNLALALLRDRQFEEGFELYENRLRAELTSKPWPPRSLPQWDGSALSDMRLLLYGEQGLGDVILHAQAIDGLLHRQDVTQTHLTLVCDQRLHDAFARRWPGITFMSQEFAEGHLERSQDIADVSSALPSLHRLLGSAIWTHYGKTAYLAPDAELSAACRQEYLDRSGGKPIIGVSWRSSNALHGTAKSLPDQTFAEAFWGRKVWCLGLDQKGYGSDQEGAIQEAFHGVPFYADKEIDPQLHFEAHLAQIGACDLIVTVSNTVAHAAGAMGKPVLLLLPKHKGRYWYWFNDPQNGLWYPNVTALAQRKAGDWSWPVWAAKRILRGQAP